MNVKEYIPSVKLGVQVLVILVILSFLARFVPENIKQHARI